MEFNEDQDCVRGIVPEFGAIIMLNIARKREFLKRNIVGLPSSHANFVKQIKAGMLLFLFEFEKRELFGVFQATSDGAVNIVPHAFSSSGKQFPAQVRFAPIWYCAPLTEKEFCDAIRDNYYSPRKFMFGLSKSQVYTLLQLFNSRRLNNKMPRKDTEKKITRQVGKKDRQLLDFDHDMRDDIRYAVLSDYSDSSLDIVERADDVRFMMGHKLENEHKVDSGIGRGIWTDNPGDYWSKPRKINNKGGYLMSDSTENELFNDRGPRHTIGSHCLGDSLGKRRRGDDDVYNLGHAISNEHLRNSYSKGRRITEDDRFLMNEREENERHMDTGYGPVNSTEHHEKRFGKGRLLLDDNRFLVTNEHSMDCHWDSSGKIRTAYDDDWLSTIDRLKDYSMMNNNDHGPTISPKDYRNYFNQGRRVIENDRFLINEKLGNEFDIENDFGLVNSTGPHEESFGKGRLLSRDNRLLVTKRGGNEHSMDNVHLPDNSRFLQNGRYVDDGVGPAPAFATDHIGNSLGTVTRSTGDGRFLMSERVETDRRITNEHLGNPTRKFRRADRAGDEHIMDNGFGPGISTEFTRYTSLREDKRVADGVSWSRKSDRIENVRDRDSFIKSSHSGQKLFVDSNLPDLESDSFSLRDPVRHSSDFPHPIGSQPFSTSHVDPVTRAVPYDPEAPDFRYQCLSPVVAGHTFNWVEDHHSSHQVSEGFLAHFPESEKLAQCLDGASGNGNKVSFPYNSDHPRHLGSRTSNKFLNEGFLENSELQASVRDRGPLSVLHHGSSSPQVQLLHHQGKRPVNHETEFYQSFGSKSSDTQNDRASVFARLNEGKMVHDKCDMGASFDQVIDSLQQAHDHWAKTKKHRPSIGQSDVDENVRHKEKPKSQKKIDIEQPVVAEKKIESDVNCGIKENGNNVLEETRLVDFKRRSKIKINLDKTASKSSTEISDDPKSVENAKAKSLMSKTSITTTDEGLLGKPAGKRRKLIRPVFGEKECPESAGSTPTRKLPNQETCYKGKIASCGDSVISGEIHVTFPVSEIHVTVPVTSENGNTTLERTLDCKLSSAVKICEASVICEDGENGRVNAVLPQIFLEGVIQNVGAGLRIEDQANVLGICEDGENGTVNAVLSQIPLEEANQSDKGGLRIKDQVKALASCEETENGRVNAVLPQISVESNQNVESGLGIKDEVKALASCEDSENGTVNAALPKIPIEAANQNDGAGLRIEGQVKVPVQDLVSMIGSNSSAQDSPLVLPQVTCDAGSSKCKEGTAEVTYPVSSKTAEIL